MTSAIGIRLVVLDLDRTLWDHEDVSGLIRPFRRVAVDAVEDQHGARVTLSPGARRLLEGLRKRAVVVACASWNEVQPVDEIFSLLELDRFFDYRKVEPHPRKQETIGALFRELAEAGLTLTPDEVLYVDDRTRHLDAVRAAVGPVRFLHYGVDIRSLDEVLNFLDRDGSEPALNHLIESPWERPEAGDPQRVDAAAVIHDVDFTALIFAE